MREGTLPLQDFPALGAAFNPALAAVDSDSALAMPIPDTEDWVAIARAADVADRAIWPTSGENAAGAPPTPPPA